MKLDDMNYFVKTVNAKSINKAAKILFMTQPALSRKISAIEQELGFPLLERSQQGIVLTKIGQKVYDDCVKILELYTACNRQWQDMFLQEKKQTTIVRIVALPMICNTVMNQIFCEVSQKYPQIQLLLFEAQLPDILQKTLEAPHTICFSHYNDQTQKEIDTFANEHDMQLKPLFDDEYKFFASFDNPLSGQKGLSIIDLKNYPLATYSINTENATNAQFAAAGLLDVFNIHSKNNIFLSNRYTIMELTASNQSIMITGDIITRHETHRKNVQIIPLVVTDFHLPMTYYIMYANKTTIEETIIADMLCHYYCSLQNI